MTPAYVSLPSSIRVIVITVCIFAIVSLGLLRLKYSTSGNQSTGSLLSRTLFASHVNLDSRLDALYSWCPKNSQGKRVLVTGAAGFIGHRVSNDLKLRGDCVLGLDNFNDYYPVSLKRAREADLASTGVTIINADINDPELMTQLFKFGNFTHVVHLAAQAGVRYAKKNPMSYINSNIVGSVVLMEAIRSQETRPILVYASSSSVYGLNKEVPFSETDRVDNPASLYAATKRSQELLTFTYHNLYQVSATGVRFFTVYGPWGRPDMSVYSFTRNIMAGKPIRVFKGPNNSELARDFTFIADISAGVLGALDSAPPSKPGQATFRLFNLGNTRVVTVSEMVKVLEKLLGRPAIVQNIPVPNSGDVLVTNANITAAKQSFGYAPATNIEAGLKSFVDWYFKYYGPKGSNLRDDELFYVPD